MRWKKPDLTLIEWLVVAAIVGIVASIVAANVWGPRCVASHVEHNRLLYIQKVGDVMIPVYGDQTVCDRFEER